MFGGLSAKERMAQLQAKSAKDNPPPAKPPGPAGLKKVGKPNGTSAAAVDPSKAKSPEKDKPEIKDAGKGSEKPKEPEKKEDAKPAEKPAETKATGADKKTPDVKQKEEAKPKEPEKPKEESKKPEEKKDKAAAAKPKEEPKPKENEKPKEEAKKAEEKKEEAKPKEEKPKDEPKPAEKSKDAPKPEVKEPSKPAEAKKDDSKPAEKQAPKKEDDKKKEEPSKTAPTAEKSKEEIKPSATEKPKEEPKAAEKAKEEKPKEEPKAAKPQEPSKPKEETPKAKEGPKPEAAPAAAPSSKDAAKPKEDQPAKPAQAATAAATQDKPSEPTKKEATSTADKKPTEEAKKDAKPKDEAKPAAAAAPAAVPKETPKAKEEPAKPAQEPKAPAAEPKKPEVAKPAEPVKAKSVDDLYTAIFYFSGMGNLLGSALAEGVFVPERSRSAALDADEVEKKLKGAPGSHRNGETVVATARAQAHVLSNDFRQLQALLETMPKFGDTPLDGSLLPSSAETAATKPVDRRAVDQPIHGHVYFQQPDRPAHQQPQHHQQQQQQQQHTGPPFQMTPTAVAVRAADEHNTVVHLASLSGAGEGKGRPPAAGAVQVLPTASPAPQANYTSTVYRPPQQSKTPTFADAIDNFEANQHHLQPSQHGRSATGRISPYGGANDYDLDGARKSGGNVDASGVKSWQLSHLRTLEAKGYRVLEEPPAPAPPPPPADVTDHEIFSYSPYLVSGRTLNADRRQTFQKVSGPGGSRPGVDGYGPSPTVGMMRPGPSPRPASFRPASVGSGTYPFSPVPENSLPYCDL